MRMQCTSNAAFSRVQQRCARAIDSWPDERAPVEHVRFAAIRIEAEGFLGKRVECFVERRLDVIHGHYHSGYRGSITLIARECSQQFRSCGISELGRARTVHHLSRVGRVGKAAASLSLSSSTAICAATVGIGTFPRTGLILPVWTWTVRDESPNISAVSCAVWPLRICCSTSVSLGESLRTASASCTASR